MSQFTCPKHRNVELWGVLRGGAGYCCRCLCYVQAVGIEQPTRDKPKLTEAEWRTARRKAKAVTKAAKPTPGQPEAVKPRARLIKRSEVLTANAQ